MNSNRITRIIGKAITSTFGDKATHYCKYPFERSSLKKALSKDIKGKQLQKASKVAIVFIGTGKYIIFFPRYYNTIKDKFIPNTPKDFFVFTDQLNYPFLKDKKDVKIIFAKHVKWPESTMFRYKLITKESKVLKEYSHIIYIDADTYINTEIHEEEFFSHNKPFFGVQHYAFIDKIGEFEYNPISLAAVSKNDNLSNYWVGTLWGGQSNYILDLCKELEKRISEDFKKNFIAIWHDESHLNKYLIERKHLVHTLSPSYAYPENKPIPKPFKKKVVHILKNPDQMRKVLYN